MTQDQRGQVAIVTGGARRIGAALAAALHERGLAVLVHCRNSRAEADALVARLEQARPGSAAVVVADLADDEAPERIVEAAREAFGGVDVLVNNASTFYPTPLDTADAGDWQAIFDSNLRAPFWLSLAAAAAMPQSGGSIVNLVDIHGLVPLADHAIYSQAKAGLVMQTRALAKDLAPRIRVNAVAPGTILWPEGDAGGSPEAVRGILDRVPLGRQGTPGDVAGAVCFLALDAPYVTGQVLAVDGGRLLHM